MALVISEAIYQEARARLDQGDVTGAWGILAAAGDSYAAKARVIVGEWQNPQSIFAMTVDVQWARAGVSDEVKQAMFPVVAARHFTTYLNLIAGSPDYRLPKTDAIEASYRNALEVNGLPAAAAIESIFSAADHNLESNPIGNVVDTSWGTTFGIEVERVVYDSTVFSDQPTNWFDQLLEIKTALQEKYGNLAVYQPNLRGGSIFDSEVLMPCRSLPARSSDGRARGGSPATLHGATERRLMGFKFAQIDG